MQFTSVATKQDLSVRHVEPKKALKDQGGLSKLWYLWVTSAFWIFQFLILTNRYFHRFTETGFFWKVCRTQKLYCTMILVDGWAVKTNKNKQLVPNMWSRGSVANGVLLVPFRLSGFLSTISLISHSKIISLLDTVSSAGRRMIYSI